jgi:hypothetical protein
MRTNDTVQAIASRHFADSDEGGRTCRACGRPWPCDVRQIVVALTMSPTATALVGGLTTNAARRVTPVVPSRSRRRVAVTPSVSS